MPEGRGNRIIVRFVVLGAASAFLVGCLALASDPGCREECAWNCTVAAASCEQLCEPKPDCILTCDARYQTCLHRCNLLPPCSGGGGGGGDQGGGDDTSDNNPPPVPVEIEPLP